MTFLTAVIVTLILWICDHTFLLGLLAGVLYGSTKPWNRWRRA